MIRKLRLRNFKSHKDTELTLENLTVLTGQNGVGKSSVIQSMLLLRQTNEKNRLFDILDLNSPLCFIGKSNDAIYRFPNKEFENKIGVVLSDSELEYSWIFEIPKIQNKAYLKRINDLADSEGYEKLSLFNHKFQYLSAFRGLEYITDDYAVEFQKQISVNEGRGELVAHFLSEYGKKIKVIDKLKHHFEKDDFLLSQVSAWEREISKNVNVFAVPYGDSYDIKYSFDNTSTDENLGPVDDLSKKNVGFGLSYVLPVIVAILASEKDSLILIENPEAHIHPYGISKLSELICLAAEAGVQIIVETHSDHIINGILVQSKKFEKSNGEKGISKENLKIYYFERDEAEHKTKSTEIKVIEGGRTENRVTGFFDQIGKDLRELI
jgi:predicted ATPase